MVKLLTEFGPINRYDQPGIPPVVKCFLHEFFLEPLIG